MLNFASNERGACTRLCQWLIVWISLLVGAVPALAQDEDPPEPRTNETPAPPDVLKDGTFDLSTRVYLLDKRNRPVFVPTTFEQYLDRATAAARRAEGGDAPHYAFDEFFVQARALGKVADVEARVKITLNELARKNNEIPLRLHTCLLTEKAKFEGAGTSQIQVGSSTQPGYTWSLQAESNTMHSVKLVGQSVVQTDGDRHFLPFALPAALCTVQLTLPANIQDIMVRGQGGELTSDEPVEGGRRLSIKSLGGDLNVSWRTGNESKSAVAAAEARSMTTLRIDDPREAWLGDSSITVTAQGDAPIESLVVELPEGSERLASDKQRPDQYTLVVDEKNPRKLTIRAAANVNLAELEIQIRYRWKAPAKTDETSWSNLVVPNILIRGVDRHEGNLTLSVPNSLALDWKSPPGVALTRVGELPDSVQYVFHFVRQPLGLNVSFRREVNLPKVRPTYLVEVDRHGIKLTGWLRCAFDRAKEQELTIDLGDWQLDSAEVVTDMSNPGKGDMLNQQFITEGAQRIVKLSSQLDPELSVAARREQQIWRITAFRSHAQPVVRDLTLAVPSIMEPDQDGVPLEHVSGLLFVAASENVMLDYDTETSSSLLTDAMALPSQTQLAHLAPERVLSYRFQSGGKDKPVWSGSLEILSRRIAAEQSVQLKVDPSVASVHQRFQLQIANEPLHQLQVATNGAQEVSVLVDGIPWVLEAPTNADKDATATSLKDATTLIAKGGRNLLGKVLVEIYSQHALPKIPVPQVAQGDERWDAESVTANIPLVSLDIGEVVMRGSVAVLPSIDRRLQVSLASEGIASTGNVDKVNEEVAQATWIALEEEGFEIKPSQTVIALKLVQLEGADPLPVRVSGAWIQSVVSGSTRADRFCARFKTNKEFLDLRLPANDLLAQVAVDGVEQVFNAPRDGQVQIRLPGLRLMDEHTLEVWTRSSATAGWVNKIEVVPIEIDGCARFDHFYWQLVTSPNMHLAMLPEHLTPEWTWVWDRLWWQRSSPMEQVDLEQWLSASSQRPLPQAANKYVVSSYGSVAGFHVWTVSRLLLWLPIGLISIGGALLVSLFRSFRHPAALLLLIACVLSTATIWPDLAILLGQTALVALVIVLLYALTQAAIESRVRRRSVFTSRPTSVAYDASDNHTQVRPLSVGESDVMPTTRTQSPVVAEGGGS